MRPQPSRVVPCLCLSSSAQSSKTPSASIAKHEKDARGFQKVPCGGRHLHSRFEIHSSQVMKSPLSATTGNEQRQVHYDSPLTWDVTSNILTKQHKPRRADRLCERLLLDSALALPIRSHNVDT